MFKLRLTTFFSDLWKRNKDAITGYLFIFPALAIFMVFIAYPFAYEVWLSFHEKYPGLEAKFIGLENFLRVISDPTFHRVSINSCVYTFTAVSAKLLIGLGVALLLNQKFKARGIVRALVLIPWALPTYVSTLAWRWMYDYRFGLINYFLLNLGIAKYPIMWLGDPKIAMASVIIVNIWRGVPFFALILLAGLQTIPTELYEAADVDGANAWQKFRYITLPYLKYVMLMVTLISTLWTFSDFEIVYLLTKGGPVNATHLFATYTYEVGFIVFKLGLAATVPVLLVPFFLTFMFKLTQLMMR
jgi:multiple sugar transport system permease protein